MDDRTKNSIAKATKYGVVLLLIGAGIIFEIQSKASGWQALLVGPSLVAGGILFEKYKLFRL